MKTFSTKPENENTQIISCAVCGCSEYRLYWDCRDFSFQICKKCGVLYQNPQPTQDTLIERYSGEYFDYELENDKNFYNLMELGLKDIHFDSLAEKFNPETRAFLDIGCATGMLLEARKKEKWEVQGVEVCGPAADYGIKHRCVPIYKGTLESAGFSDGRFDFIHFSHVIEHIADPRSFLMEIRRIVKKGGYIAVTTPNVSSLQAFLFKENWRSAIADHMYLFRTRNLEYLFKDIGFIIIKKKTWGGLAHGVGPKWLKGILDPLSKKLMFGDVVLYLLSTA